MKKKVHSLSAPVHTKVMRNDRNLYLRNENDKFNLQKYLILKGHSGDATPSFSFLLLFRNRSSKAISDRV